MHSVNEKIARCQKLLEGLPGIELTRRQQEELYNTSVAQLQRKQYDAAKSMFTDCFHREILHQIHNMKVFQGESSDPLAQNEDKMLIDDGNSTTST